MKTQDPQSARARMQVILIGDDEEPRREFEVGESVAIFATGLKAGITHEVTVILAGREAMELRLISDIDGSIPTTILWAQLGLDDPWSDARYTLDEALRRWGGTEMEIRVHRDDETIVTTAAKVSSRSSRPLVLVADSEGRPLNAIEPKGSRPFVLLANMPFDGPARVLLVHRQQDWHVGTPLPVAATSDGRPAVFDVKVKHGGSNLVPLRLARGLPPGAYDLVVRQIRYGYEADERLVLNERDVLGGRRITGLVVREPFWTAKPVLGGCVNKIPVSGRTVSGAPYFRYTDTFEVGASVWGALDPGIVDPNNISKMCAFYVIANKSAAQWGADNSLTHLPVLGGNAAVTKIKLQPGCINANKVLLWPNATQVGEYDIVADFGNNTSDAAAFVTDAQYNTPLDIIDGYFVAGFRVVEDPGTLAEWANTGNWNYDEASQGTATVQDESSSYSTPGGFMTVNANVPRRAHVFFPADAPGVTDPGQISAALPDYPLIVVVHGNGHSYTSYDFLLQHLARNGFVAASIHLNGGMRGLGRANVLFEHLAILKPAFGAKLQNHIGLMGHSRGGEAVVKAARLNQQGALGHGIDALISLAPTDQYGSEVLGAPWATPYFVLYGSRDGDITGGIWTPGYTVPQTGFALYDRSNGAPKHMVFVHRASHNGFITANENNTGEAATCIPPADQQKVTLAYMNAFFRTYLRADNRWAGMFTGEWQPPSVAATGAKLYIQNRQPGQRVIDDFQSAPAWSSSSIGGAASETGLPATPSEGKLHDHPGAVGIDPRSPHDSNGQRLRWDAGGDRIEWTIPAGQRDVSAFAAVSIRIGQTAESPSNPLNLAQNLRLSLKDGANNERAIRVGAFHELPYPDVRPEPTFTKSALLSVRIPLASYMIVCAGQPKVDLTDVVSLALVFSETPAGEIDIDEIEFTS